MRRIVLLGILVVAAAARLWYLAAGVPHAVGIDEPLVVDHATRILKTGDWNPHIFNYPTLVIYGQAAVLIVRFLLGALRGEWMSLDGFTVAAIYTSARLVTALIGVATVWLTYRLGLELARSGVALLAAAQMAVRPMHVRESHFALTDVPMAALTTAALWASVRAGRRGTVRAYALAGAASGFAAAAKYTGGVAFVAVIAAWIVYEWRAVDRGRKLAAAGGAAAGAFLIAAPYTVLDLPSFLDGFASLFAQYAGPLRASDPAWSLYAKHLWIDGPIAMTLAVIGMLIVLARRGRGAWTPIVAFAAAYFYELSTHSHVFGRYALPLLPVVCLLSSAAVFELVALAARVPSLARPPARRSLLAALTLILVYMPAAATVRWLDAYKRPDTRTIAADWLKKAAPKGARVAVENSGPTYLDGDGFALTPTDRLIDHDAPWYRERVDYLIVSESDLSRYADVLGAGSTVFEISPTPQRWGPPVRIVRVAH